MGTSKNRPDHKAKLALRNAKKEIAEKAQAATLSQVDAIASQFGSAFDALKASITALDKEVRRVADVVDALAKLVPDQTLLADTIKAVQEEKSQAEAKRALNLIERLVAEGVFKEATVIKPGCVLGLCEKDGTGKVVTPYLQAQFDGLGADLKNAFNGKGVGAVYNFPHRDVMAEVIACWEPV